MSLTVSEAVNYQFTLFGMAVLWGTGIVGAYDVIRIFRRVIKHSKVFVYIEDIIFWISEAFVIYHLMYVYDNGAIRSYTILGMFIGMFLYSILLSRFFVKIVSKILNYIINLILKPLRFLKKIMKAFFGRIYTKLKKIINYFVKRLKKIKKTVRIEKEKSNKT